MHKNILGGKTYIRYQTAAWTHKENAAALFTEFRALSFSHSSFLFVSTHLVPGGWSVGHWHSRTFCHQVIYHQPL